MYIFKAGFTELWWVMQPLNYNFDFSIVMMLTHKFYIALDLVHNVR